MVSESPDPPVERRILHRMAWLVLVGVVIVLLVAGAVLPRRDRLGREPGFPWFWVVFPVTCFAVAVAVGVFAWPEIVTHGGSVWWGSPSAGSPGSSAAEHQFLSSEQYQRYATLRRMRRILPAVSIVGIGLCVWAWRRRRI